MIEVIHSMPVVELFLAGIFALISTEAVKWIFNIKESSIGLHSSNTGKLMKTRYAAFIFTIVIFSSNVIAFIIYNQFHSYINSTVTINTVVIDSIIFVMGVLLVWLYLKKNHYNRTKA